MAREVVASCNAWQSRIIDPVIEAPLALCQSDHLPLSEPAQAIREILLELVAGLPGSELASTRRAEAPRRVISAPYRGKANTVLAPLPALRRLAFAGCAVAESRLGRRHGPGPDQGAHRCHGRVRPD